MFSRQFCRAIPRANALRTFSTSSRNQFAKINIIGNLADSPELIVTSTGREILQYAVASNSGPKDNRRTSWFKVTAFVAEGASRDRVLSLTKGSLVYVEGDAEINKYDDKEGITRTSLNIVQRNLEIIKRGNAHENE